MHKYVIKRILFLIPTIIGVTLIIYFVMNLTPGDPGRAILGTGVPQEAIDAYNHNLGYDLPFFQKFLNYLYNMFINHDFGISYVTKQSVFAEIWPRYMVTLKLAFIGVVISALLGIPLGIYSAVKQYSLMDTIPSLVSFFLAAVPTFVLGLVLLYFFSLKLNWLPSYGLESWKGYIMPALAISIPTAAQNFRFTKSSMLEAIRQDYVRTARAKGAPESAVIWKHVLKNALLPVITQIGMSLGMLLCGAVVAEQLFSVQGIGSLIVERITFKDEPIIIAGTILISICFTVVMLIVDIIYAFIDPRIRAKYTKARG
ncbi:ABC transporter permease [Bacilliculturomica massiliensis]|uniref:ABC transporter permease n=1 Tax=Bacilliculturomica massiliensis TaxID=1917867 RepID=UPI001030F254|nr:ABC transporter permease [Bacilliculturomica massiliensis]